MLLIELLKTAICGKDLSMLGLSSPMALNRVTWKRRIHIANPKWFGLTACFLLLLLYIEDDLFLQNTKPNNSNYKYCTNILEML